MLLAELQLWHTRPVTPTRRIALGHLVLPTDPAPGLGGVLLAAVVGKAVATELIDPVPEFVNPNFYFTTFDMVLCFFIGPLFGFLSFLWVKGYYFFEDRFQDLPLPDILPYLYIQGNCSFPDLPHRYLLRSQHPDPSPQVRRLPDPCDRYSHA